MKKKHCVNYLDLVFEKNPDILWTKTDTGLIVLSVENRGFYNRIAQIFFKKPPVSYISLDKNGSCFWQLLDGKKSVFDIIKKMEEEFPSETEMMNRGLNFFRTLQVNKFIIQKKANLL